MGNGDTDKGEAGDPERNGSFEQRLARARERAGLEPSEAPAEAGRQTGAGRGDGSLAVKATRAPDNPLSLAMRLGVEMVAAMVIAVVIGWGVDRLFHTRPFFMIAFVPVGMAAGIRNLIRAAGNGGAGSGGNRD